MTTEKHYEAQRAFLQAGKTLSGALVTLPRTDEQNYARTVVSGLQADLLYVALGVPEDDASDAAVLEGMLNVARVADGLARALSNPEAYGDNEPGLNTTEGVPILPAPVFTHWDLVQFGYSCGSGTALHPACNVPQGTPLSQVLCAAGLLECDWAVRALEEGRAHFATYLVAQAFSCLEILQEAKDRESGKAGEVQELQRRANEPREHGLKGLDKRWGPYRAAKAFVQGEWKKDPSKYNNVKLECARVHIPIIKEKYHLDNIRDYTIANDWLRGL